MHQALLAPDDEVMRRRIAPGENVSVSFEVDPELGDAAAELAGDLGRSYIDAATSDADVSEAYEETSGSDDVTFALEDSAALSREFETEPEAEERERAEEATEDEPVWTPKPPSIREMSRRAHASNR